MTPRILDRDGRELSVGSKVTSLRFGKDDPPGEVKAIRWVPGRGWIAEVYWRDLKTGERYAIPHYPAADVEPDTWRVPDLLLEAEGE